jgi:hypothetical protein
MLFLLEVFEVPSHGWELGVERLCIDALCDEHTGEHEGDKALQEEF